MSVFQSKKSFEEKRSNMFFVRGKNIFFPRWKKKENLEHSLKAFLSFDFDLIKLSKKKKKKCPSSD